MKRTTCNDVISRHSVISINWRAALKYLSLFVKVSMLDLHWRGFIKTLCPVIRANESANGRTESSIPMVDSSLV